ncbi:hypothetical protein K474DRAFT_1596469 [Panus rudis PR-1116 ss-1]|nr:hypothetical protein K474DRAFT_1596469 [Panus rudis PR-1116 ss-1]
MTSSPLESLGDKLDTEGVGLSDAQLSSSRREMLNLMNRLHSTGVQLDMDLPMIAVIGSQSAGKSSLIESISGITLPRASGTCTRVPTECKLTSSPSPWQCTISLRFITDVNGQPLRQIRNEAFGEVMYNKTDVEERIRRAQRAILNPSTSNRHFLDGPDEDPLDRELTFSKNYVSLQISGSGVADLSFVDLPGLIASVGKDGSDSDIELVENLVKSYIERPSCIILLTVACEADFETQGAHRLAKLHDPEGRRIIGVLTKPDRIPLGEEERWLRFIRNEEEPLDNGWYSVKQPDSRALKAGITWSDARTAERDFFSVTSPWSSLDYSDQQRLGTMNLTERLSSILSELIAKRLPELQEELQNSLQKTDNQLRNLPKPPSSDPLAEILHLLADFSRDLSAHLEGTPNEDGLLQSIRPAHEAFKKAIRATAPDFRPYEGTKKFAFSQAMIQDGSSTCSNTAKGSTDPSFLANEEERVYSPCNDLRAVYIDEVMKRADKAITRELPDHYPFVVCKEYIATFTSQWETPAERLFASVYKILHGYIKGLVELHFGKFAHGGMQHRVLGIVTDFLKLRCDETKNRISWLLDLERRPHTLNGHYYSDYRDKFLAHYKGSRRGDSHGTLMSKLETHDQSRRSSSSSPGDFKTSTRNVLTGLAEIGITGTKAIDLAKLLPADPYEPALHIMATVRAYFQVAYKRFADNVPMAIDYELVLGLDRDRALENALMRGLGITGPDGFKHAREYLQEPPNIVSRREELQKKRERLISAQQELLNLWL